MRDRSDVIPGDFAKAAVAAANSQRKRRTSCPYCCYHGREGELDYGKDFRRDPRPRTLGGGCVLTLSVVYQLGA